MSQITAYVSWHNSRHWIAFETSSSPVEHERLFSAARITTLVALGPPRRWWAGFSHAPERAGAPAGPAAPATDTWESSDVIARATVVAGGRVLGVPRPRRGVGDQHIADGWPTGSRVARANRLYITLCWSLIAVRWLVSSNRIECLNLDYRRACQYTTVPCIIIVNVDYSIHILLSSKQKCRSTMSVWSRCPRRTRCSLVQLPYLRRRLMPS